MVATIGGRDIAHDIGNGADAVHVRAGGFRDLPIALHDNTDLALLPHGLLDGSDRNGPPDGNRKQDAGKQNRLPDWQYQQIIRVLV